MGRGEGGRVCVFEKKMRRRNCVCERELVVEREGLGGGFWGGDLWGRGKGREGEKEEEQGEKEEEQGGCFEEDVNVDVCNETQRNATRWLDQGK